MRCHMSKDKFNQIKKEFNGAGTSMRCDKAKALLTQLGFNVRDGKRGGHKIFTHPGVPEFRSGSLNCDHGKNPEIKKPYINKIIRILDIYEADLIAFLDKS